jgi:hypothetical protein
VACVGPACRPSVITSDDIGADHAAPTARRADAAVARSAAILPGERGQNIADAPRSNGRFSALCADHPGKGLDHCASRLPGCSQQAVSRSGTRLRNCRHRSFSGQNYCSGFDRHDKMVAQAPAGPRHAMSVEHQETRPRKTVSHSAEATNPHSCNKIDARAGPSSREDQTPA